MIRHACLAALLAAAPLAHVQLVDIAWDAQGRFQRELRADPGKFVELCGKLRPGTKVRWRFDADAATNFNIHYHEGKEVHYPTKQDGARKSQGTLDVRIAQDYCWMWSNKGSAPATIAVEMSSGS